MLINNFGSLKTELARYMFHQRFQPDYDLATQNFEAVANRRLRVRQQEAGVILTTIGGSVNLPLDYLLWRAVYYRLRRPFVELDYVHPLYYRTFDDRGGDPEVFMIENGRLSIRAPNDAADAYGFLYYQKIPTITGSDLAYNWLTAEHPDLYLEGVLTELFILGRNGEAAVAHKQLRDEKFSELIQLSALSTGATSSKVRGDGAALGSGGEYF